MLAGAQYRGDFEKRIKKVLTEISKEEKPIVFIDEIHRFNKNQQDDRKGHENRNSYL